MGLYGCPGNISVNDKVYLDVQDTCWIIGLLWLLWVENACCKGNLILLCPSALELLIYYESGEAMFYFQNFLGNICIWGISNIF